MEYRDLARAALRRARQELDKNNDERLIYAALELRRAVEALTYERAALYAGELPEDQIDTWQPQKLIAFLLELDPLADKTGQISIGVEPAPGQTPEKWIALGEERVLSIKEIKKYYHRISSYLHVPTPKNFSASSSVSYGKLRKYCEALAAILKRVLKSRVWKFNVRASSTMPCTRCNTPVVRRLIQNDGRVFATCIECGARYDVIVTPDAQVTWQPRTHDIKCGNAECSCTIEVWEDHIRPGLYWTCNGCNTTNRLMLGVIPERPA